MTILVIFALSLISISIVLLTLQWYGAWVVRQVLAQMTHEWQSSIHLILAIKWSGCNISIPHFYSIMDSLCKQGIAEYRDVNVSYDDLNSPTSLVPAREYKLK